MEDSKIDLIRDILKHLTIDEAFTLTDRYARSLATLDKENVEAISVEAARFLRKFVRT